MRFLQCKQLPRASKPINCISIIVAKTFICLPRTERRIKSNGQKKKEIKYHHRARSDQALLGSKQKLPKQEEKLSEQKEKDELKQLSPAEHMKQLAIEDDNIDANNGTTAYRLARVKMQAHQSNHCICDAMLPRAH